MSKYRENVTWQSPDGTWNRGFHACFPASLVDEEDYDQEWDVNYDFESFEWVSAGHSSEQAANDSWRGANPVTGGTETDPDAVVNLEDMAAVMCENGRGFYEGPKKKRTLLALTQERNKLALDQHRYDFDGYSNDNRPRIDELDVAIAKRLKDATPGDLAAVDAAVAKHLTDLRQLSDSQASRLKDFGWNRPLVSALVAKRQALATLEESIAVLEEIDAKTTSPKGLRAVPKASGGRLREKDTGAPSVNEGRFAAVKKSAPAPTNLGAQHLGD